MDVGTALAVVAFADQCLKYGNKFVKRCRSYLHADEEAAELLLVIESSWIKMHFQIEMVKKIAGSLDKRLQDMQCQVLSQLEGKFKTASLKVDQLLHEKGERAKNSRSAPELRLQDITVVVAGRKPLKPLQKAKYALKKNELRQAVDEIEEWQARYDPSWFLIMQRPIGDIDKGLHECQQKSKPQQIPIALAAKGIRDAVRAIQDENCKERGSIWIDHLDLIPSKVSHSSVEVSSLHDTEERVIIDTMVSTPESSAVQTLKGVRNLARILAEVDPVTFGLLKCRGVLRFGGSSDLSTSPMGFKFVLNIPPHLIGPQSLRNILLSGTRYPLDERLELAKKLANSVLFVHTAQFVHKNIRPETIVLFRNERSDIGAPFLVGFEQFRVEDGRTYRAGDDVWEHNLYRHPSRQGMLPEVDYQMQHDIYSLGVVLLEIGLWTSFVLYGKDDGTYSVAPNDILGPAVSALGQKPRDGVQEIKLNLEDLAAMELPTRLGKRYTEVVLLCLRCIDSGGFGAVAANCTDEDGITIGASYIENVLEKMQQIMI